MTALLGSTLLVTPSHHQVELEAACSLLSVLHLNYNIHYALALYLHVYMYNYPHISDCFHRQAPPVYVAESSVLSSSNGWASCCLSSPAASCLASYLYIPTPINTTCVHNTCNDHDNCVHLASEVKILVKSDLILVPMRWVYKDLVTLLSSDDTTVFQWHNYA